jgi:superfamily II DNA or RNA helicase
VNREQLTLEAIEIARKCKNLAILLPTGMGKTRISLEILRDTSDLFNNKWLVVVAERAHIKNWIDDAIKHKFNDVLQNITFVCYASLKKYKSTNWDGVIYDESHRMSAPTYIEAIKTIITKKNLLLTATMSNKEVDSISNTIGPITSFKYSLGDAIESDILPTPKIHLVPLELDDKLNNQSFNITKGSKPLRVNVKCRYSERWNFLKIYKDVNLEVVCTELEKYSYLCGQIDYYQLQYYKTNQLALKNKWLFEATQRKRFIAGLKTKYVRKVIDNYQDRFICFAGSIKQCNELGGVKNIVHSKISNPQQIIDSFNDRKINQLFVVDMLREGVNLVDANAIIVQLDSKSRSCLQMVGRSLRKKEPVIHIFYYKNTQDEIYMNNSLEEFKEYVV